MPEPRTRLVDHPSQFRIFWGFQITVVPLNNQVVATLNDLDLSPKSNFSEHRIVVEALYDTFMGTCRRRRSWHSALLAHYIHEIQLHAFGTAVVDALLKVFKAKIFLDCCSMEAFSRRQRKTSRRKSSSRQPSPMPLRGFLQLGSSHWVASVWISTPTPQWLLLCWCIGK